MSSTAILCRSHEATFSCAQPKGNRMAVLERSRMWLFCVPMTVFLEFAAWKDGHLGSALATMGLPKEMAGDSGTFAISHEDPHSWIKPSRTPKASSCLRAGATQIMGLHGLHSRNTEGYVRADLRELATSKGARWRASTEQTTNDPSKGDVRDVGTYVQWTQLLKPSGFDVLSQVSGCRDR